MHIIKLGLQLAMLLTLTNVVLGSPFKIFRRQSHPLMKTERLRNGRNSKVMLFNHANGPKTVSPISLEDETTTEIVKEEAYSNEKDINTSKSTEVFDTSETTTPQDKEDIDDTFQALLGLNDDTAEETINEQEEPVVEETKNVSELLADLEKAMAQVDADYEADLEQIQKRPLKGLESEDISSVANDLADELIAESLQKDRLPKDHESKFDIEHNFSLEDDIQEDFRNADPQNSSIRKADVALAESPILQIKQQPTPLKRQTPKQKAPQQPQKQFNKPNPQVNSQSQFQAPQQGFNNQNQFQNQQSQVYSNQNNFPAQVQQPGFSNQNQFGNQQFANAQQQQYNPNQQQRFNNNQNQFTQGYNGQTQFANNQQYGNQQQLYSQSQATPRSQAVPRQFVDGQERATLLNNFGDAMGDDANIDPERNQFAAQPQLNPRQQAAEGDPAPQQEEKKEEEVRCINKVMQVEETVYENRIKCQHTFTEKCHDTFITDYIPTQERKCETSFQKNCHITYKPMMFEETVELCNEPLKKVCNNETEGKGEEICKTHYETNCETRFKEHEVEQDEPVCEMVIERKCNDVRVPVPGSTGFLRRNRRQAVDDDGVPALTDDAGLTPGPGLTDGNGLGPSSDFPEIDGNQLQTLSDKDLLSIGEECEEWPIQKCTLEKKLVKKVNPETSCQKMPREICAPGNCIVQTQKKVCRQETRNLVQNIPSEQCDLEPQENCKMETVLVPRLVQQPNCIKVPKEICVNQKSNPKKVKKPVVKEWCYKPSDLKSPSTRLALSQFFSN